MQIMKNMSFLSLEIEVTIWTYSRGYQSPNVDNDHYPSSKKFVGPSTSS